MVVETKQQHPFEVLIGNLIQGGLSYLRWTQTVPMILAWAFALFGMLAALFVGFQEEGFAALIGLSESFPGLAERLGQQVQDSGAVSDDGSIQVTDELLIPWILRGWGILAALLMIIDWVKQRLYPRSSQPSSLRRKLAIALGATVIVVGIMVVGSAAAGAGAAESVIPVLLIGVLLFGVSAYSLGVSHLIGKVQLALDKPAVVADQDDFLSID